MPRRPPAWTGRWPWPPPAPRGATVGGPAPRLAVWQVSQTATGAIEFSGWLRWWLDNRVGLDVTDVTGPQITAGALSAHDVLVVPSGSDATAGNALGEGGRAALSQWLRDGGRLVTLLDSSRLATRLGLTSASFGREVSSVAGWTWAG